MRHPLDVRIGAIVVVLLLASGPADGEKLPPETLRGPAHLLEQYPKLSLATPQQRAAAQRLLADIRASTRPWADPARAVAAGFRVNRVRRNAGNRSLPFWLHAESNQFRRDRRYLDSSAPDTLIYADVAGRPLVLIGVMFSMPRGMHGPTPGGPITRWHSHYVCAEGERRGVTPRADGSCPRGTRRRLGSEMLHVWFTRDLRSSFAIHAPVPELCVARYVPRAYCHAHGHHG